MESLDDQYGQLYEYFHILEGSQKSLFNPMLSQAAFAYIEEDFLNMLSPLEVFDPMVPGGEYIISDDPRLWTTFYGDALYYRTALNNTNLLLIYQRELGEALQSLISEHHGIGVQ